MDLHELDEESSGRHGPLMGAIFMANRATRKECFRLKLFGLPASKKGLVKRVKAGMMLFLFDHEERCLYGVFEAASDGHMNILPSAYSSSGMSFPAQIKFKIIWKCKPLKEDEFCDAIKDNYFAPHKFHFDLSSNQVIRLLQLFSSKNTSLVSYHENPMTEIYMKIQEISSPAECKVIEKSCSVKQERIGNNRHIGRFNKFSRAYREDAISSSNHEDQFKNSETLDLSSRYVVEPHLMISTNSLSQNNDISDENLPFSMLAVYRDVSVNENPSAEYKPPQLMRPNSLSIATYGGNSLASASFSCQPRLHTCAHEQPSKVFRTCNPSGQNDNVYTRFSFDDTVNNSGSHSRLSQPERRAHLPTTNYQNLQNQIKYDGSGALNEPVHDYFRYNYPCDSRSNICTPDHECYDPSSPLIDLHKTDMLLDREPDPLTFSLRERDYGSCSVANKNKTQTRDWYKNHSSGSHSAHMPLPHKQTFLNNLESPQSESMQRNQNNSVSHYYEGYKATRDYHLPCCNTRNRNISCSIIQSADHPRYSVVSQFSAWNHFSSVSRDQEPDETIKDYHFLHSSRSSMNALSPRPIDYSASAILADNNGLGTSQFNLEQNPSLQNKFSSFSRHCEDYTRIEDCGLSHTNGSNLHVSCSSLPSDCLQKNGSVFSRLSIPPEKNALSTGEAHESDMPSLDQLVNILFERSSKWVNLGVSPKKYIETSRKPPQNSRSQVELGNSDSAVKIEPESQVSGEIGIPFVNFRRRSEAQKLSGETTERTKKRRKLLRPSFGEYDTHMERCMPDSSQEDSVKSITQNDEAEKSPPIGNLVKDSEISVNGNTQTTISNMISHQLKSLDSPRHHGIASYDIKEVFVDQAFLVHGETQAGMVDEKAIDNGETGVLVNLISEKQTGCHEIVSDNGEETFFDHAFIVRAETHTGMVDEKATGNREIGDSETKEEVDGEKQTDSSMAYGESGEPMLNKMKSTELEEADPISEGSTSLFHGKPQPAMLCNS